MKLTVGAFDDPGHSGYYPIMAPGGGPLEVDTPEEVQAHFIKWTEEGQVRGIYPVLQVYDGKGKYLSMSSLNGEVYSAEIICASPLDVRSPEFLETIRNWNSGHASGPGFENLEESDVESA